jgi:ribosomal protein L25 (general stress protein Ctc)
MGTKRKETKKGEIVMLTSRQEMPMEVYGHRQESKVHGAKNRRDHESHRVFLKQK